MGSSARVKSQKDNQERPSPGSLVLYKAFLQHGLKEKNVKSESPATKRKNYFKHPDPIMDHTALSSYSNPLFVKKKTKKGCTDAGNISKRMF